MNFQMWEHFLAHPMGNWQARKNMFRALNACRVETIFQIQTRRVKELTHFAAFGKKSMVQVGGKDIEGTIMYRPYGWALGLKFSKKGSILADFTQIRSGFG